MELKLVGGRLLIYFGRKLSDLSKDSKLRLTEYIRYNINLPSYLLAKDLCIDESSIITAKGNITRKIDSKLKLSLED